VENDRIFVVFDGHDGAGKSTLARLTAELIDGTVVKPFGDLLGDHIAWLWGNEKFQEADWLARSSIERVLSTAAEGPLVFDRHWATMYSVLPSQYWENWHPLPRTIVCHTTPEATRARLAERGEDPLEYEHHVHYQEIYRRLGQNNGALVLDTTHATADESMKAVKEYLSLNSIAQSPARDRSAL
jgi:thymidylate kinase